jgi:hypothetical protein
MEAASRPPLEPLPDLSIDEPSPVAAKPKDSAAAAAAAVGAGKTPASAAAAPAAVDPAQTGLNFIDPELFLKPGQEQSAVPVLNGADAAAHKPEPEIELELEDPVVDEMLTSPMPPPVPPAPPKPAMTAPATATAAAPVADKAAGNAQRETARVPLARTASLSSAAKKVAAASAATGATKPAPKAAPPVVPTVRPAGPTSSAAKTVTPPKPQAVPDKAEAPASKPDAPSLASWANARASAASKPGTPTAAMATTAPAPRAAPTAAAPAATAPKVSAPRTAAPAPASAAATPAAGTRAAASAAGSPTTAVPASPPMDRDFIARNQVVERYLSGRLPIKAATEFERFCHDHPALLDEIGLPERVNAGLRLLEASGKPEPWQEARRPLWQRPQVTLGLAAAVVVFGVALALTGANSAAKTRHIGDLEKQATERTLDPATSTREIRVMPSRTGASNAPAITIGSPGHAQLADLKIDESRSPYHTFRVTIDRIDQGRVGIINNLEKDSNGHLRIALNSSALGPGNYQFTLEGLDWHGQPQPDSWVTIGIMH